MSAKAKAINTLYKRGKITKDGVRKAVEDGVITEAEYMEIVGEPYMEDA
ncbi:MAG: XkdX family protein [Oscillospiraceae bacterium]|nr:XkdX family protein [Oscillospiraceae bacterium]